MNLYTLYYNKKSGFWKYFIFLENNKVIAFDYSFIKTIYINNDERIDNSIIEKMNVDKLNKTCKHIIIEKILELRMR